MPPVSRPFLRVGLTGGIATGKSFCLRRFAQLGAPTVDADAVARAVVEPGTAGFDAVVRRFGSAFVTPAGTLDRAALGRLVFADAEARRDLERLVHPAVYQAVERWFEQQATLARDSAGAALAIADIPLLFETNQRSRFDRVIVAACTREQQLQRLMARDGLSLEDARLRIDAQLPIDDKRHQADFVIDTSGTIDETTREVDRVWNELRSL